MSENYTSEKRCCTVCDMKKVCHVCDDQTLWACSDCQINLGATVYVCGKRECREAHESICSGRPVPNEHDWLVEPRHIEEYHEDHGPVLWWTNPICEPPYVGAPHHSDWPGYHEWWTPLPNVDAINERMKTLAGTQ